MNCSRIPHVEERGKMSKQTNQNSVDEKTVVYLLGDSITQGLGSRKVNFTDELQRLLGDSFEIVNLAYTGTCINYPLNLLNENEIEPSTTHFRTYCIILYGNVDAQIRPNRKGKIFPHIPQRYRGGGMLMPRPFYSHSSVKKLGQHFDNVFRWMLSTIIKVIDGTEQWTDIDSFRIQYSELVNRLLVLGITPIICSCVYIDEKLFPGSQEQYELFNEQMTNLAAKHNLAYIDLYDFFQRSVATQGWNVFYNYDHFHPNGRGYEIMAKLIFDEIEKSQKSHQANGSNATDAESTLSLGKPDSAWADIANTES